MSDEAGIALASEASKVLSKTEIDRLMNIVKLDAYSLLELEPGVDSETLTRQYRRKSLLVHPDKTSDTRAADAFDLLKAARDTLLDDEKRGYLDRTYADARRMVPQEQGPCDSEATSINKTVEKLLVEDELRRRKLRKARQEHELREQTLQDNLREKERKDKIKEALWESARDVRVENWRRHLKKKSYKKSSGKHVLG